MHGYIYITVYANHGSIFAVHGRQLILIKLKFGMEACANLGVGNTGLPQTCQGKVREFYFCLTCGNPAVMLPVLQQLKLLLTVSSCHLFFVRNFGEACLSDSYICGTDMLLIIQYLVGRKSTSILCYYITV